MRFFRFFATLTIASAIVAFVPACSDDDEMDSDGGEQAEPEPEPKDPAGEDGIMKILAIGNSYGDDAVEQNLWELFDAAGIEAILGNLRIGSSNLEDHYNNAMSNSAEYSYRKVVNGVKTTKSSTTMQYGIVDEDWDYISVQQSSPLSGIYDAYNPYLPELLEYIKGKATNKDMEVAFYQTWADAANSTQSGFANYGRNQMIMYNGIMDASSRAVADNGIKYLIPAGTTLQNGRNTWLGDTFNRDGHHLEETYGQYAVACAWFETFSGIDVTTTTWAPDTVSDEVKDVVIHAAHFAVLNPYEINPMTDWQ